MWLLPSPDWAKLSERSHVYSLYTAGVPASTCVRGWGLWQGCVGDEARGVAWGQLVKVIPRNRCSVKAG